MESSIRKKRDHLGFTQSEIADDTKTAIRTYQRYESCERIPDVQAAIRIADFLQIKTYNEFKELFGRTTQG